MVIESDYFLISLIAKWGSVSDGSYAEPSSRFYEVLKLSGVLGTFKLAKLL